jgi:hypothetical protein
MVLNDAAFRTGPKRSAVGVGCLFDDAGERDRHDNTAHTLWCVMKRKGKRRESLPSASGYLQGVEARLPTSGLKALCQDGAAMLVHGSGVRVLPHCIEMGVELRSEFIERWTRRSTLLCLV